MPKPNSDADYREDLLKKGMEATLNDAVKWRDQCHQRENTVDTLRELLKKERELTERLRDGLRGIEKAAAELSQLPR